MSNDRDTTVENEISETQELLLALLPLWHARIARPLKQMLADGVSLQMYYCIQALRFLGGHANMTELARYLQIPKQQATKLVNKLVERQFVSRMDDPNDRRIVRVQLTDEAMAYVERFLKEDASAFRALLEALSPEDREHFKQAVGMLLPVFASLSHDQQTK